MQPLEMPDSHYVSSALGWMELGNRVEALAELAQVSPENQRHPGVLDLRWQLLAADRNWDAAFAIAQELIAVMPDEPTGWLHCAYALRRKREGSVALARDFLEPTADRFPQEAVILFNLACYECQLQQLERARYWLGRALEAGDKKEIRAMALADEDLKALWPELKAE